MREREVREACPGFSGGNSSFFFSTLALWDVNETNLRTLVDCGYMFRLHR